MLRFIFRSLFFWALSHSALAAELVKFRDPLTQGSLVRATTSPNTQVWLNGQPLPITPQGEFVMGFGRDAALSQQLVLHFSDGQKINQSLTLSARDYNVQRIEGIAKKIMQPNPADVARAKEDALQTRTAREHFDLRTDWKQNFIWPVTGRISGVYGSQRVYNGTPGNPHFGIDIAAPTGTKVLAPASGEVTLAVADMFYSGGTLILDHGFGVSSTFIHLSKLLVKPGDKIEQGQAIAEVGSTGRSTGPHLDWRLNWHQERLDPALLVGPMPKR